MGEKTAITISRQFCCGGAKIGHMVASRLGYRYADREVLQLAAERLGLPVEEISGRDERLASFWEKITSLFTYGLPDVSYTAPPFQTVTDQRLFELQARIIREFAAREDCVIVGRGGVHVLGDHPGAVHVFLHAPDAFRVERAMEAYGAPTREKALSMIRESDRARQAYLARLAHHDWTLSTRYHLCLDTGVLPPERVADIIELFVQARQASQES
ncbi:MAG: cytidylate kinase-like family protein [Acidobacteria bacterium]|nr:cytidylate kinase-like family protein [Acidobacteriota bacterium]